MEFENVAEFSFLTKHRVYAEQQENEKMFSAIPERMTTAIRTTRRVYIAQKISA